MRDDDEYVLSEVKYTETLELNYISELYTKSIPIHLA